MSDQTPAPDLVPVTLNISKKDLKVLVSNGGSLTRTLQMEAIRVMSESPILSERLFARLVEKQPGQMDGRVDVMVRELEKFLLENLKKSVQDEFGIGYNTCINDLIEKLK